MIPPHTRWFAPAPRPVPRRIWLDEEDQSLRWEPIGEGELFAPDGTPNADTWPSYLEHEADVLLRFSRLGDAEPERILSFAQRFGVLELCAHERPHTHPPLPDEDLNPVGGAGYCRPTQREPLRIWRSYATRCAAVMRIAERVHDDAPGSRDDWEIYYTPAFPTDVSGAPDGAGKTLEGDRYTLGRALDGWLAVGGVRARLEWGPDQGRPKMSVGSPTLFGAIAREIAFVASGSGGLLQCHGCGALFTPDRKPRKGERPWCVDCSEKGEPLKAAKRRYRQRRRRHNRKERD